MSDLRKKTGLLVISVVLLICSIVYMSFAWYTKMTSMAGLSFKTAKWDISANHQIENFSVNVYEYSTIGTEKLAAPGVWGTIPITVSASNSNTDVSYTLTVDKSTMSREFQERVYFYYYTGEENAQYPTILPPIEQLEELIYEGANPTVLEGTVPHNGTGSSVIYWHWIYDYDEWLSLNNEKMKEVTDILNKLYADNPSNLEVLYDSNDADEALKTSGLGPQDTYYQKTSDAQYVLYNNEDWAQTALRPTTLYVKDETKTPPYQEVSIPEETTELIGEYYYQSFYVVYTGGREGAPQLYVKVGNVYEETEYLYSNELFVRTMGSGTTQHYALSGSDISTLNTYRSQCVNNPDSVYAGKYQYFFKLLYRDYTTNRDNFDNYDTQVGLNPSLYASKMSANIVLTGEQVTPSQDTNTN